MSCFFRVFDACMQATAVTAAAQAAADAAALAAAEGANGGGGSKGGAGDGDSETGMKAFELFKLSHNIKKMLGECLCAVKDGRSDQARLLGPRTQIFTVVKQYPW